MAALLRSRTQGYVFEALLPLWRDHGRDHDKGGFHERLDKALRPVDLGHKRLLVQCRQAFTFAHACHLGHADGFAAAAHHAFEFLDEHYRSPDGGWIFSVATHGAPRDGRRDLYAHGFLLFSMAHLYRAFGDRTYLDIAAATVDFLVQRMQDSVHGGFHEGLSEDGTPLSGPRRQNPHMHLLEGLLALSDVTQDDGYLTIADSIVRLFHTRFFDGDTGTLREYFGTDWVSHPERGHIVEPGHHFEWCWLLHEYARLRGDSHAIAVADSLFRWGLEHGIDSECGGIFDEVDPLGAVLGDSKRIWPVTEFIKAASRLQGSDGGRWVAAGLDLLFASYLHEDGRWNEQLDRTGTVINDTLPATTSYHLVLGMTEALRVLTPEPASGAPSLDLRIHGCRRTDSP